MNITDHRNNRSIISFIDVDKLRYHIYQGICMDHRELVDQDIVDNIDYRQWR